jgi:hypothetical protein
MGARRYVPVTNAAKGACFFAASIACNIALTLSAKPRM